MVAMTMAARTYEIASGKAHPFCASCLPEWTSVLPGHASPNALSGSPRRDRASPRMSSIERLGWKY